MKFQEKNFLTIFFFNPRNHLTMSKKIVFYFMPSVKEFLFFGILNIPFGSILVAVKNTQIPQNPHSVKATSYPVAKMRKKISKFYGI